MGSLVDPMLIVDFICRGGMFARVCRLAAFLFNQSQLVARDSPDGWGRHQSITRSQFCLAVDHPFIQECVVALDKSWPS
jgi:hypothetical protein